MMSRSSVPCLVYPALLLQTAISAGTYLSAKHSLAFMGWPALVMLRNLGAAVLFLGMLPFAQGSVAPPRADWGRILLLGLLGIPVNQALFIAGLAYSTPSHAALLYTLTPLFVLVIGLLTGAERIERGKAAGLLLALVGAMVVVLVRSPGEERTDTLHGDLLILVAVVAWALFTIRSRELVRVHGSTRATAWSLVAGTVLFLPIGAPPVLQLSYASLPWTVGAALVFLVLMTSFVAYLCWSYALEHLEPSRVAVFTNLQPVATALLAWAAFGEAVTLTWTLGAALVIAGVWLATRPSEVGDVT